MQNLVSTRNSKSKSKTTLVQPTSCYDGETLCALLKSIQREMEASRELDPSLPHKIWLKQQVCVGVNEVTRVLERMPPISSAQPDQINTSSKTAPKLQAILVASDCNPRWLTKHLPVLAASRNVPVILVKDKTGGSVRLGQLVNLKTAIALGIKARGNSINQVVVEILNNNRVDGDTDSSTL